MFSSQSPDPDSFQPRNRLSDYEFSFKTAEIKRGADTRSIVIEALKERDYERAALEQINFNARYKKLIGSDHPQALNMLLNVCYQAMLDDKKDLATFSTLKDALETTLPPSHDLTEDVDLLRGHYVLARLCYYENDQAGEYIALNAIIEGSDLSTPEARGYAMEAMVRVAELLSQTVDESAYEANIEKAWHLLEWCCSLQANTDLEHFNPELYSEICEEAAEVMRFLNGF